jgi:hypothetical protein
VLLYARAACVLLYVLPHACCCMRALQEEQAAYRKALG